MNRCLKCYLPLEAGDMGEWHRRCSRSFFSTDEPPLITLDDKTLQALAAESCREGWSIAGVQPKLSVAALVKEGVKRFHPSGYIIKPQSPEYPHLPQLESVAMHLSDAAKIRTVEHALVRLENGQLAYITKRIDRRFTKDSVTKIAMEDFCQLSDRLTEDKYKGSYEQCGTIVQRHSSQAMLDLTNLFYLLVFSFVIGNNDMHLKNFSLYTPQRGRTMLTVAYDLLPVTLVLSQDKEETALTLCGKKNKITRRDFLSLAKTYEIPDKVAVNLISRLLGMQDEFALIIRRSFLDEKLQAQLIALIEERVRRLSV
ncbi:MAG: HipA domain-containing protein [Sphaerochaeta sp.]|jgi:serine/threonine-protein kinase HipA|nr:HipA domain-containing protein [Sphaerochaeta sp.]MDX9916074.1 HipA domain-containing protein [Sphaerochaeta sp.]